MASYLRLWPGAGSTLSDFPRHRELTAAKQVETLLYVSLLTKEILTEDIVFVVFMPGWSHLEDINKID